MVGVEPAHVRFGVQGGSGDEELARSQGRGAGVTAHKRDTSLAQSRACRAGGGN